MALVEAAAVDTVREVCRIVDSSPWGYVIPKMLRLFEVLV